MKIREVNAAMLTDMRKLWVDSAPARADQFRDEELLRYFMMEDGGDSQWYVVPPASVIVINNVKPGLSADFLLMNGETPDYPALRSELRQIMREYDLRRINWTSPANVTAWAKIARLLGFQPEGRLRDALTFDLNYVDAVIFGLHRSEVEYGEKTIAVTGPAQADLAPKKKRRRRRGRRKKKNTSGGIPPITEEINAEETAV
jgi:hypothetical protein